MNLNETDRDLLNQVADLLIPPDKGMPSASQAGVAGPGLDAVLKCRPELEPALTVLLSAARGRAPQVFLSQLKDSDPGTFNILAEIVAGAYFMNPDVRATLGYDGQTRRPINEGEEIDPALLRPVIDRGPIYRS